MSTVLRSAVGFSIGLALLAAMLFWRPAWLTKLGVDPGQALDDAEALNRANQRAEALESWHESVQNRVHVKDAVLQELIDHHLTLLEAGARIKPLIDKAGPRYQQAFRKAYRGSTDEERVCRHLITCVWDTLKGTDPVRADEEATRLEAELKDHLENGPLTLPPLPRAQAGQAG